MKNCLELLIPMFAVAGLCAAEFQLPQSFLDEPFPERFTSLQASWEKEPLDADFALSSPLMGGFGLKSIPGFSGKGIEITEPGGQIHYRGESNLNPETAVIQFRVRGPAWKKGESMTLFSALRESYSMDIVKRKDRLSLAVRNLLYIYLGDRSEKDKPEDFRLISEVSLPLNTVSTEEWQTVTAGWDLKKQEGFIALNGKGRSGKLAIPQADKREFLLFLLGGAIRPENCPDGLSIPGMKFDELKIASCRYSDLLAWKSLPQPSELLARTEKGVRKTLSTLSALQRMNAGWQNVYTYPGFLGAEAQGRQLIQYDDIITNDKSRGSAYVAAQFAYAYELLQDYHALDIAKKTADFYVRAQSPEGAWLYLYKVGPNRIECGSHKPEYKFQDSCQSHPLYLLAYMYRLTGTKQYLEAMKKCGEFYLSAQNPDGSWSHHYDMEAKVGRTCRGLPQGGEINDLAMNDAIDVMILMYHLTKERKYIDAVKRAGEWLLKAQFKGAVCGWADQYDREMNPIWARHFEPPALSWESTRHASQAMVTLYRLSGDERYREALRSTAEWFQKKFPDGKCFAYYDIQTGRPVLAHMDHIYFLDDPEQMAKYASFRRGKNPVPDKTVPNFRALLAAMVYPVREPELDKPALDRMRRITESLAKMATNSQNRDGLWVYPVYASVINSVGAGFIPGQGRLMMQLRYIDVMRMMRGELPLRYRGGIYTHGEGNMRNFAWPSGWYDIPWK